MKVTLQRRSCFLSHSSDTSEQATHSLSSRTFIGYFQICFVNLWVRSFSFPEPTPICPRGVRIALTSFQGLTRVSPLVPCLWSGPLGGDLRFMTSPQEGQYDRSISSCQGITRVSTAGSTQGSLSNAPLVWLYTLKRSTNVVTFIVIKSC